MNKIFTNKDKKALRRKLRRRVTAAERALWASLRRSNLGAKFRRQHSVGRYVVDFYCPELKLAIELEGGVHQDIFRSEYDDARHADLVKEGIRVLYFQNPSVFETGDVVVDIIRTAIQQRLRETQLPLLDRRGNRAT